MAHLNPIPEAVLLILAGATANGSFGLLLKRAGPWRWEHIWLIYSLFGMAVIPWAMAASTVPSLPALLATASSEDIARVALYGLGWGVGSVLYGLALKLVGLGLSYAIVMGLTAAIGSLAPLVLLHREKVATREGSLILIGVAIVVAGVVLSGWAGHLKSTAPAESGAIRGRLTSSGKSPCSVRRGCPRPGLRRIGSIAEAAR